MIRLLLTVCLLSTLSSCWPTSVSFIDNGSMPPEWKTFYVRTLTNKAANAPLSYAVNLSEKIKDGIQNNTRLMLISQVESSDVLIEGVISDYSVNPIAVQPGDVSSKNRLSISVQFTIFVTKPKQEELKVNSVRFVDYASDQDLGVLEANLLEEINKQIVQDFVNKLLSNW